MDTAVISQETITRRIGNISETKLMKELNNFGCATIEKLLSPEECNDIAELYAKNTSFRSHVHMARHGFGKGEYKYFSYPLPDIVTTLRKSLYSILVPVANAWNERMGIQTRFPLDHEEYLKICHAKGQTRPTPLLLQYGEGDFNCLHQDVYGDLVFPIQVAVLLSSPGQDFIGGDFVLTEQRPRMQSRVEVAPLLKGDAVIFAVRNRPVKGTVRDYRVNMRHGVSRLKSGRRHTLGVIFHDAK